MSLILSKASFLILLLILSQSIVQAKKLSSSESWGYGILVGITIGACGFLGACMVIGCRRSKKVDVEALNKMLISFAIGTLIGDAFIHLIPKAFAAHSHKAEEEEESTTLNEQDESSSFQNQTFYNASIDSQEHAHGHNEGELTEEKVKVLCAMLCLGYFIFFVMENFMHVIGHHTHSHSHHQECENDEKQHHSHQFETQKGTSRQNLDDVPIQQTQGNEGSNHNEEVCQNEQVLLKEVSKKQEQQNNILQIATQNTETELKQQSQTKQDIKNKNQEEIPNQKERSKVPGFLNLFSDFLHNILDGLAIGVAFGDGDSKMILSTFIAVLAHEIPQEVGDAGILLNSGFTSKWVLLSNGFVNFSALLGTFIGLGIGSIDEEATNYLYAFIAANFIYIAASDMLPQVIEENRIKYVLIHGFLMLLGMGIMWGVLELEAVTGGD